MKKINLKNSKIVVLGATSAIARASCEAFAEQGATLYLASRNLDELERLSSNLRIRYNIDVFYGFFDAEDTNAHIQFFNQVLKDIGNIDGLLLAFGYLGSSGMTDIPFAQQEVIFKRNLMGAVSILTLFADYFERARSGFIITISSISGDRGRRKNYVYAAAKSGLTTYLQGLRNRLFASGIRVITIKPGFVETPMTVGCSGMFLVAQPEKVGRRIVRQLALSGDIVYIPWFWRYLMLIIKLIPESLYKRLSW